MQQTPMPQFAAQQSGPAAPPKKPRARAKSFLYGIPIALAISFWFLSGVASPGYTWRDVMDRLDISRAAQPRYSRLAVLGVALIAATAIARVWKTPPSHVDTSHESSISPDVLALHNALRAGNASRGPRSPW